MLAGVVYPLDEGMVEIEAPPQWPIVPPPTWCNEQVHWPTLLVGAHVAQWGHVEGIPEWVFDFDYRLA